jgi:hypothetical protein
MKTTHTVEKLTPNTVAVRTIVSEGTKIISKSRSSYCNSNHDREELQNLLTKTAYNSIIKVWGDKATVEDLPDPRPHE